MDVVHRPFVRAAARTIFAASIALTGALASPASAEVVRAVEYYHQAFEHYFVTSNPAEVAALDAGVFTGWWRTAQRYRVDDAPGANRLPVCRFYTSAFAGKASHFFTASATECAHLKASPVWTYEGVAFYARVPDAQGSCAAGTAAIHRLFNNGQGGAPNHAYTADITKLNTLVGAGWVSEGVAYCTPLAAGDPVAQTQVLAGTNWSFPTTLYWGGDPGFVVTRFDSAPSAAPTTYVDWRFSGVGLPLPAVVLYHHANSVWTGASAWDPLSGAYVVFGSSGFEGPNYAASAWTFDNALGQSTPVCAMSVWFNVVNDHPFRLHPYQPALWSGCEPGIANRL